MLIFLDNPKYEFELNNIAIQYSSFDSFEFVYEKENCTPDVELIEIDSQVRCTANFGEKIFEYHDQIMPREKSSKNAYKRVFYQLLQEKFGTSLDWGILTGIRPTKLFQEHLQGDNDVDAAKKDFVEKYKVSSQKADILAQVSEVQTNCLRDISQNDYSIYVSVPFCPSRCNYCTFFSNDISKKSHLISAYLDTLEIELKSIFSTDWVSERKSTTLYIGGGTPSALDIDSLDRFLKILSKHIDFSALKEITFEAGRPDTLDIDKLKLIHSYGIERISINPQTMVPSTLQKIGRNHSVEQIISSFQLAREAKFHNINMDIILGLEEEKLADVEHTLHEILKLEPDSITVHSLALKKASDLSKVISDETRDTQSLEVVKMMQAVYEKLNRKYFPYYLYRQKNILGGQENVGFAKNAKESLYNMIIIEEYQNILAFGPGAISRFVFPDENRIEKTSNTKNLEHYINHI